MIRPMSPEALRRYIDECTDQPLLLDVREEWECRHCHIEGSIHIPMAQIPARIASHDPARKTVLICHRGVRGQRVALSLESRGFQRLVNLGGGADACTTSVDMAMPRY